MSPEKEKLLNDFQHCFPLVPRPFQAVAERLGIDEQQVLAMLESATEAGTVSRVGPVFTPHRAGVSTLAAMSVTPQDLDRVAELISAYPEVNHNYERDHEYNLWFVITAPGPDHLQRVMDDMQARSGYALMALPLERDYHIDLGFPLGAHQ